MRREGSLAARLGDPRRIAVAVVLAAAVAAAVTVAVTGEAPEPRRVAAAEAGLWVAYADRDRVRDVAVDPDGDLWAATDGGLLRRAADGWEAHTVRDGLPDPRVVSVAVADDGTVWAGTRSGIGELDGDTWSVHDDADGPRDETVLAVATGDDGEVWVATGRAVARFDGTAWSRHDGGAQDVAVAGDGTVWTAELGQPHGVVRTFDGGSWTEHDDHGDAGPLHHEHDQPLAVTVDDGGEVWVGTRSGVSRFDGTAWHRHSLADAADVPFPEVGDLVADPSGVVWAATWAHGVWRLDGADWAAVDDGLPTTGDDVHPMGEVTALTSTGDGTVWAGLSTAGVARLDDGAWRTGRPSVGLPAGVDARDVARDGADVWVATLDHGVWHKDAAGWRSFTGDDGLPTDRVRSVVVDDGTVWAGTDAGPARFDGDGWTSTVDGPRDRVDDLAVRDGQVWAATPDGLWHHDARGWTRHGLEDGLPDERIWSVHAAADGTVWVATDGGPARLRDGAWQSPDAVGELPHEAARAVTVAPDGTVWVATLDERTLQGAVAALDPDEAVWRVSTEEDGLLGPVADLHVDEDGLWAAGQGGVSRHDGEGWTGYTLPRGDPRALARADDGSWWVAVRSGVGRLLVDVEAAATAG